MLYYLINIVDIATCTISRKQPREIYYILTVTYGFGLTSIFFQRLLFQRRNLWELLVQDFYQPDTFGKASAEYSNSDLDFSKYYISAE